ncbi:MAG: hypothetical protein R2788_07650 [Saprospiraceae bacterium]
MKNKNAVPMIAERYDLQEEDVAVWFSKTKWNVANEPQPVELKKVIKSLLKAGIIEKEEAVEKRQLTMGKLLKI